MTAKDYFGKMNLAVVASEEAAAGTECKAVQTWDKVAVGVANGLVGRHEVKCICTFGIFLRSFHLLTQWAFGYPLFWMLGMRQLTKQAESWVSYFSERDTQFIS